MLDSMFFKDETLFHLSAYIGGQHGTIWSAENPHAVYETCLYLSEICVWCTVSRK